MLKKHARLYSFSLSNLTHHMTCVAPACSDPHLQIESPGSIALVGYSALTKMESLGLTKPQERENYKHKRAAEIKHLFFGDVRFRQTLPIAYWHVKTLMDAALALRKDAPDARASVSNPCQPLNETPRQTLLCEHICPSPKKKSEFWRGEGAGGGAHI